MSVHPLHTGGPYGHWQPGTAEPGSRQPLPFKLTDSILNCGREELHLDKITSNDTLMTLWPWMREGLLYIKRRNSPQSLWLPEHVRLEIQKGFVGQSSCECFIGHVGTDDTVLGFVVAYPLIDPFVNLPLAWHVWMGNLGWGNIMTLLPEFEELARARGYRRWQWGSARKSWERRAERFGARVIERTIAKELF